jgi:hypothetical protein
MSGPFVPTPTFHGLDHPHHVLYQTPDGKRLYTLTGTAMVSFHASGQDWTRGAVEIPIDIPDLPPGMGLSLIHWAPLITLAAISNDNAATNAAWAVDRFRVRDPDRSRRVVRVSVDLAVRDADGFILRLGYYVHLLGVPGPDEGTGI